MKQRWWLAGLWTLGALPAWAQLEVNRATAADLEALRGVGPQLAWRIVQARRDSTFRDWADLQARVQGIGPATAARLSAQGLVVEGLRYPAPGEYPGSASARAIPYEPMRPVPMLPAPPAASR